MAETDVTDAARPLWKELKAWVVHPYKEPSIVMVHTKGNKYIYIYIYMSVSLSLSLLLLNIVQLATEWGSNT